MFERFTDRARKVVVLAQENARLLNHSYIGTEHILLSLLNEGGGVAALVLTEECELDLEALRVEVEEIVGHGSTHPSGHIPFTPRAKKILELALREALQLGHNYIGTEHLLLGLIREGEGVAAIVLVKAGLSLSDVRQYVIKRLAGYASVEAPAPVESISPDRAYLVAAVATEIGRHLQEWARSTGRCSCGEPCATGDDWRTHQADAVLTLIEDQGVAL